MKRVQPRQIAQGGFTLIEVLIGISIFAIGMLAVARLQMHTVRNTTIGNVTSQATMLAHQKMEELKTIAFADLTNEVENNIDEEGNTGTGGIYQPHHDDHDSGCCPLGHHARQIQVQVQWNAAHGGNRTVAVNSLTYERW